MRLRSSQQANSQQTPQRNLESGQTDISHLQHRRNCREALKGQRYVVDDEKCGMARSSAMKPSDRQ